MLLALHPYLHFSDELPKLGEHEEEIPVLALEGLDPLESYEHGAGFVHAFDASANCVSAGTQLCNAFVAEQSRVELAQ